MIHLEGLIERKNMGSWEGVRAGCMVYEWPQFSDEDGTAYLSEVPHIGQPLKDNKLMIYYKAKGWHWWCKLTREFLGDLETVKAIVSQNKERYKKQYAPNA